MEGTVADYSAGYPDSLALKAAGFVGAVRYIGLPGNRKCATEKELDDFTMHGLGMALVFEHYANDWRKGFDHGIECAQLAVAHATAIGWPVGQRPIYMAVDQDVTNLAEMTQAMLYLDGASRVLGQALTGVYGEHDVCQASWERGYRWQWQCRAWSGVPDPKFFGERRLFQRYGTVVVDHIPCDVNDVNRSDWGQHNYQESGVEMTPEESRKLGEIYDVIERVGREFGGEYNFGDLMVDLAHVFHGVRRLTVTDEIPNGKDLMQILAEQYNVVAENYAITGKGIGRTTAETGSLLRDVKGQLDQIAAAINRLEGGGTEGE